MSKPSIIYPNDAEAAAYELLPCGVIWTDLKQQITFVNTTVIDLLGYKKEKIVGERRFYELLSIGGKLYFETHFSPALALKGDIRETSFEMVAKNGERHPVVVNAVRLATAPGGYVYVVLPAKDRREYEQELKRARLKAEAADKAKATFISSMSHEIRTPLHAILEAGNFLLKDNPHPDQLEFIKVLRGAGTSLLSIVNDILDISKLEAGMTTLDMRPVHADQIVKQVVDTYRPTCRGKGVELRSVLPFYDIPLLLADGGKLIQVLNNLVSNAVKFTNSGEILISLNCEEKDDEDYHLLNFRIRDTGRGIPTSRLENIFEPFVQASNTTHAEYGGTGLGLAICKKILEASGADLKVNSKVGAGTEFYFTLKLKAASKAQIHIDKQAVTPAEQLLPLNHLRVLNVDDNPSNLLINSRYFADWKLNFDQKNTGAGALKMLDENEYDIILLDLRMPDMDGYELAEQIRSHPDPAVNQIPIVALSASASVDVSPQMLDAGINDLVVKPFEPGYLHQIIRRYGEQEVQRRGKTRLSPPTPLVTEVNFSKVKEIFDGDGPEYLDFLRIITADVTEAKTILTGCAETHSPEEFSNLQHNLVSTINIFQLTKLSAAFENGKLALDNKDKDGFAAVVNRLVEGLDGFDKALAMELSR